MTSSERRISLNRRFQHPVWPEAGNIRQAMVRGHNLRATEYPWFPLTLGGTKKGREGGGIYIVQLPQYMLVHWDIKQSCQSGPDCRKQSQEMEMHCVTASATLDSLFGRIFLSPPPSGNPLPWISPHIPEMMCEYRRGKKNKTIKPLRCHVRSSLRLLPPTPPQN